MTSGKSDLIAKLEAAEEGNDELSYQAALAFETVEQPDVDIESYRPYTTSLSDAVTGVPEGALWQLHREKWRCVAEVSVPMDEGFYSCEPAIAATPELALTAACLKARDHV